MMNNMRNLIMACVMVMASICVATARQASNGEGKKNQPNMERFSKMQAYRIAKQMRFDDATTKKFVKTFCDCRREIGATRMPQPTKRPEEMSNAEVAKGIKARFQQGRKILYIREKYFRLYSKFLSPKQIQRVYDLEMEDFDKFMKRGGKNGKVPPRPF